MWGEDKNQKVFLFKRGNYWRFNPQENRVDSTYSRSMADWRGIPDDFDAAFQDRYGEKNRDVPLSMLSQFLTACISHLDYLDHKH